MQQIEKYHYESGALERENHYAKETFNRKGILP